MVDGETKMVLGYGWFLIFCGVGCFFMPNALFPLVSGPVMIGLGIWILSKN